MSDAYQDTGRSASAVGARRVAREKDLTLGAAFGYFARETPPRLLMAGFVSLTVLRIVVGGWSWIDLVVVGVMVLVQPFVEWLIHVYVLHARPFTVLGRAVDYDAARHHRAHHRDPWDLRFTVMPLRALFGGAAVHALASYLLTPSWPVFWTSMWTASAMALSYEWVHFLVHTSHHPKFPTMRRLWRLHRLHHFKNERYWFGVSRHLGDVVLGTIPDQRDVPTSETARTLGIDA